MQNRKDGKRIINVLLDRHVNERLDKLIESWGVTGSEIVRRAVRELPFRNQAQIEERAKAVIVRNVEEITRIFSSLVRQLKTAIYFYVKTKKEHGEKISVHLEKAVEGFEPDPKTLELIDVEKLTAMFDVRAEIFEVSKLNL